MLSDFDHFGNHFNRPSPTVQSKIFIDSLSLHSQVLAYLHKPFNVVHIPAINVTSMFMISVLQHPSTYTIQIQAKQAHFLTTHYWSGKLTTDLGSSLPIHPSAKASFLSHKFTGMINYGSIITPNQHPQHPTFPGFWRRVRFALHRLVERDGANFSGLPWQ